MRLFYITNSRIPTEKAHGYAISKMCEQFANLGIEVILVLPKLRRKNPIFQNAADYYGIRKNFKIKRVSCLDLTNFPFFRKLFFLIQRLSFSLSSLFIKTKKDDLIYIRDIERFLFWPWKNKNIFFEIHFLSKKDKILLFLIKRAKKVIVITKKLKEDLINYGLSAEKILIAPDGVDLEDFNIKESQEKCRRKLNLPLDKKIIGYTGQLKTMGEEKGISDLIKAIRIVGHTLCLVGGRESDIIGYKKLAKGLDIIFVGQVQHKLISYYLKSFDVLVMPFPRLKHYLYYMSPLKMFEYMAAQRPIVTSDLPSIREVLNRNNAILVQPNSPQSLAQGIETALKNTDFSAKISKKAFEDVQKYTWSKRAQNIIEFINYG